MPPHPPSPPRRPDFKLYSAYLMKPADASVPSDPNITSLLPSFKVSGVGGGDGGTSRHLRSGTPPPHVHRQCCRRPVTTPYHPGFS
jgi:hypothetical protein